LIYDRLVHGTDKPSGKEMEGCSLDTRTLLVPMVQSSNKGRGTILSIQTKSARQISTAADFSSPDSRTVTLKLRTPRGAQNRTGCPPTILVTQYERGRGRRLRRLCEQAKSPNHQPRAPLQPMRGGFPNEIIGIDLIGPLPQTPRGNRYILVMVDYFTKWATARPIVQADAKSVAQEMLGG
uniref:Integrase catalytic domain-containing protein n=1 Tax=Hymenolepis diminuta TaxID=6216 RepID=A0A0R3SXE3_HYMDI